MTSTYEPAHIPFRQLHLRSLTERMQQMADTYAKAVSALRAQGWSYMSIENELLTCTPATFRLVITDNDDKPREHFVMPCYGDPRCNEFHVHLWKGYVEVLCHYSVLLDEYHFFTSFQYKCTPCKHFSEADAKRVTERMLQDYIRQRLEPFCTPSRICIHGS